MKAKKFFKEFVIFFVLTSVVSLIVSSLYGLIVHGHGVINWASSIQMGLMFGILLPSVHIINKH